MAPIKDRSVSIIIPNFNGEDVLQEYLPYTLQAIQAQDIPFEVIVVDDSSSDNSVAVLQKRFPTVTIIENATNQGFAKSCNVGITKATMSYTLLLNSDIQLTEGYFNELWKFLEQEDTFGVMGKILNPDGSAEILEKSMSLQTSVLKIKNSESKLKRPVLTPFLSGANALVHTDKLKTLNGFDAIFSPFYSEDADLSLRAWRMGWKCYMEPKSVCYHLGSHSISNHSKRSFIKETYFRNRMILNAIHTNNLKEFKNNLFVTDVLPKLLLGNTWILKSYKSFKEHYKAILESRENLGNLLKKNPEAKSLEEVIHTLNKQPVGNFKPKVAVTPRVSLT